MDSRGGFVPENTKPRIGLDGLFEFRSTTKVLPFVAGPATSVSGGGGGIEVRERHDVYCDGRIQRIREAVEIAHISSRRRHKDLSLDPQERALRATGMWAHHELTPCLVQASIFIVGVRRETRDCAPS